MGQASDFDPRHSPSFGLLANEFAVEECDNIHRILKPYSNFFSSGPGDLSRNALTRDELDRNPFAQRRRQIGADCRPKRRDFSDFTFAARARMENGSGIERSLFRDSGRLVGPWKAVSHDDSCDRMGVSQLRKIPAREPAKLDGEPPNKSLTLQGKFRAEGRAGLSRPALNAHDLFASQLNFDPSSLFSLEALSFPSGPTEKVIT